MKTKFNHSKSAFTLIEMLAVVAIIAILASFMMPALTTAMKRAKSGHCKANLRQLMTGLESYAADNRGYWPPERVFDPNAEENKYGNPWHRRTDSGKRPLIRGSYATLGLFQYMMGDQRGGGKTLRETWPKGIKSFGHIFGTPFHCPGSWYATDAQWGGAHSYSMNRVLGTQSEYTAARESNNEDDPRFQPKKMELIQTPAAAAALSDGRGAGFGRGSGRPNDNGGGNVYRTRLRHLNKVNLSFADGHIQTMAPTDFPRRGENGNASDHDFFNFWRGFDQRRQN